jgi:hypothetical protein
VSAQEVSQVNVVTMRLAARHYRIQVVIDGVGGRQERLPACDAEISLMLPPGGRQRLDGRAHRGIVRDHYVEIDNRLGVKAGDGSAADMLGLMRDTSQCVIDAVTQLPEQARPPRIVGNHHRRSTHVTISL